MHIQSDTCQIGDNSLRQIYTGDVLTSPPHLFQLTKDKPYVPITGCVFSHVLNKSPLSSLEKLFYVLADALSFISSSNGNQRSVDLPGSKWAKILGCSRATIFSMQKSMKEKNYFIISKSKNHLGHNKRNYILPTLPEEVFAALCKSSNIKLDTKFENSHDCYFYNPLTECKRTYLSRTKLFIKLNYQLLKTICSTESLTPFAKVLWLDFYSQLHKKHIVSTSLLEKDGNVSFTTSYNELEQNYSLSKATISKAVRSLEGANFIKKTALYIRETNNPTERQDKSLWEIVLSLPEIHHQGLSSVQNRSSIFSNIHTHANATKERARQGAEIVKPLDESMLSSQDSGIQEQSIFFNSRPKTQFVENSISLSDHGISKFGLLLSKDLKLKNKNIDSLDSGSIFFKGSEFFKNSFGERIEGRIKSENTQEMLGLKQIEANPQSFQELQFIKTQLNNSSLKLEENSNNFHSLTTLGLDRNKAKLTKPHFTSPKHLKDWYPLTKEQGSALNFSSGREFSLNFTNELLLKLATKYPNRVFAFKNQFLSYMTKTIKNEKHQAPMVNHETFKFTRSDQEGREERRRQEYLSEIECGTGTSLLSQLRRKIAARFEKGLAYSLLISCTFHHIPSKESLDVDYDIVNDKTNGEVLFKIYHKVKLDLTPSHKDALTNEIMSIYGELKVTFEKVESLHSISTSADTFSKPSKYTTSKCTRSLTRILGEVHTNTTSQRLEGEIHLNELDQNSSWYKIRSKLKNHFGAGVDKSWFSKLVSEEEGDPDKLILKAPTLFMINWINNNYGAVISQYCKSLTGREIEFARV